MIHLLLPVYSQLPIHDLLVISGGVVICQCGSRYYWSICQRQVDDPLAFLVICCLMVGGTAFISHLQSIHINQVFPESRIPLDMVYWVSGCAEGIEVSSEGIAALPSESLPVQQSYWSVSHSLLCVCLIVKIDNSRYLLTSFPVVSSDNIIVGTSAQLGLLIHHQATQLP